MNNVYVLINNKGGVGKTSSTINIGAGLAKMGKTVLLVDLDSQCNVSYSLKVENSICNSKNFIEGTSEFLPVEVSDNLFILPAVEELSFLEMQLATTEDGPFQLKRQLENVNQSFDFVMIDCAPSLGLLAINALIASRYVIVPIQAQYLAAHGLERIMQVVANVQEKYNPSIQIGGILVTMFRKNTILNRDIIHALNTEYSNLVFKNKIRDSISIPESQAMGKSIFDYDKGSLVAMDYANVTMEFLNRFHE